MPTPLLTNPLNSTAKVGPLGHLEKFIFETIY